MTACLLRLWVHIPPGHGCLSVVSVMCCQVEVSSVGLLLVQKSPTQCVVSKVGITQGYFTHSFNHQLVSEQRVN